MFCLYRHRECFEERKYLRSILEIPASEFANNKRMANNVSIIQ